MQAKAALKLFSRLKQKERRIHLSRMNSISFMGVVQPVGDEMRMFRKPNGLWYGINDSWIDWCASEEMGWVHDHIHEVILDESKILKITNLDEFDDFEKEYGDVDPLLAKLERQFPGQMMSFRRGMETIRFDKVAEKYSGIEITPYLYERRLTSMWYYGWDCASGCVWSQDAVKDIRHFASFDADKKAYVRSALQRSLPVVE